MSAPTRPQRKLPDVATETRPDQAGALDGVGMERIEMPVLLPGPDGIAQRTSARVDAFVNLARDDCRGIHMIVLRIISADTRYAAVQPPRSGSRPTGWRVVSKANTIEASRAREAPAKIAAMLRQPRSVGACSRFPQDRIAPCPAIPRA